MTTVQVSPQSLLTSGWLFTNIQANITTTMNDTYVAHTYIHHTATIIHVSSLHIYHSSGQAACPLLLMSVTIAIQSKNTWSTAEKNTFK